MNNIHKFLPFTKAPTPPPEDEPKELVGDEQLISEVKKEDRERKQCKQCNFFCYTSKGFRIHMTRIHPSSTTSTATTKDTKDTKDQELVDSMQTLNIDATKMKLVVDQQSLIDEQHQKIQELEKENTELKLMLKQMKDASFEQLHEHYLFAANALNTFNNLIQQINENKKQ
jgi:hypothetical protein